jgi:hypothetical protein
VFIDLEERGTAMLAELKSALTDALTTPELSLAVPAIRSGVTVAPNRGKTGLAVGILLNRGRGLTINQPGSTVLAICAPTTVEGAADVAELVHSVLHGEIPDPFRNR